MPSGPISDIALRGNRHASDPDNRLQRSCTAVERFTGYPRLQKFLVR